MFDYIHNQPDLSRELNKPEPRVIKPAQKEREQEQEKLEIQTPPNLDMEVVNIWLRTKLGKEQSAYATIEPFKKFFAHDPSRSFRYIEPADRKSIPEIHIPDPEEDAHTVEYEAPKSAEFSPELPQILLLIHEDNSLTVLCHISENNNIKLVLIENVSSDGKSKVEFYYPAFYFLEPPTKDEISKMKTQLLEMSLKMQIQILRQQKKQGQQNLKNVFPNRTLKTSPQPTKQGTGAKNMHGQKYLKFRNDNYTKTPRSNSR